LLTVVLEGALGGVLARLLDVVAVVPVAGGELLVADDDDAGPGGAASCVSG
jgi:hypothetical protein